MTLILRLWLTLTKYLWHSSWGCGRHSSVIYDTHPEVVVDTHQLFMTLFLGLWLTLTNYLWQSSWGCGWHSSIIYETHPEVVVNTHQLFMTLILGWRCPWPLLISLRKQFVILFFKFPRFPRLSQHLIQLINAKASFSPNVSLYLDLCPEVGVIEMTSGQRSKYIRIFQFSIQTCFNLFPKLQLLVIFFITCMLFSKQLEVQS